MDVIVVGAGIGGLVLAQGLRRRGIDARVVERDQDLRETGGYRLHLGVEACAVLERELPPEVWARVLAAGAGPDSFRAMHVVDHRLQMMGRVRPPAGRHLLIGRRALRLALSEGIQDLLVLGREVTGFERIGDRLVVSARGGEGLEADLLVAADGVGSVVAHRIAGQPTSRPIGLVGLAGQVTSATDLDRAAPRYLHDGPALAIGPHGVGMFLTRHDPSRSAVSPVGLQPRLETEPASWIWGLILSRTEGSHARPDLDEAFRRTSAWSPWAVDLVRATPPERLGTYRFHATDIENPIFGWPASNVTAIGDAVHAMPPTGGQGASTAIEDSGDLLTALQRVLDGQARLATALADYQLTAGPRASARIGESMAPARWVTRTSGPAGSAALQVATRVATLGASARARLAGAAVR